jgi:hypothetical protein
MKKDGAVILREKAVIDASAIANILKVATALLIRLLGKKKRTQNMSNSGYKSKF